MAAVDFNADFQIKVVFPFLTKGLKNDDRSRIEATGTFSFTPRPQVDTSTSATNQVTLKQGQTDKERAAKVSDKLGDLLDEMGKIKKVFRKRSQNIILEYDPILTENEALADAEETLFGFASGTITYEMFEQILEFEAKVNKWLSHRSIANGGRLSDSA